jgi:hypothetical protein
MAERLDVETRIPPAAERLVPRTRLKLAVFCSNAARGTSVSVAESLPRDSRKPPARLAQAADRAGIDWTIPLGRWKKTGLRTVKAEAA